MTYSPLTDQIMPPTGRYKGGPKWSARPAGVRINGLNVHHWASTNLSGLRRLVESDDPASANYLILNNGTLIGSVPEEFRAWTTSAYANDDDKATVEIQNETGAPGWRISDPAMETLIRLHADLGKRHGYAPSRAHLIGHQEYGIATACPGPYLLPRLGWVAEQAQQITDPKDWFDMADAADLDRIVAAEGERTRAYLRDYIERSATHHPRVADLGKDIAHATALERVLILARRNETHNEALLAAVDALAKSSGLDPAEIKRTVSNAVDKALATLSITLTTEES